MPIAIRKFDRSMLRRAKKKPAPTTVKAVATKAAKAVVNKMVETKKHSVERIEVNLSTLGGFENQSLVSLASNTGHGSRIGHMVRPVGLDIRGHINANATSTVIYKVLVVQFKNNAANPPDDLLETNTANVNITTDDVSTLYRRINTDSYRVLASKYLKIGVEDDQCKMFRMWIPMSKFKAMVYEGSALAEPTQGRIHLVAFGRATGNDAAVQTQELHYVSTFYFKDA